MTKLNLIYNALKKLMIASSLFVVALQAKGDDIDDFVHLLMEHKNIPGVQLAIVKDGEIVKLESYGVSNLQDSVQVTNKTLFPINSMTKAFTGVAIMQLVEQKKLNLDAPISTYLTDIPDEWKLVTTKQILAHTSGLPKIIRQQIELIDQDAQQAWEKVQKLPFESKINTQYSYNQTGYILAGMIVEKLSGEPFTDFVTKQQLRVVGMEKTERAGFSYPHYVVQNQARQYLYNRSGKLDNVQGKWPSFLSTAAGMSATAKELAAYSIALQRGDLLKESTSLDALWAPAILNNGKTVGFDNLQNGYAMGWQVIGRERHSAVSASGGNASTMIIYPNDNLTIIVLTNLIGSSPVHFVDEIAGFYIDEMKRSNGWGVDLPQSLTHLIDTFETQGYEEALALAISLESEDVTFNDGRLNSLGYSLLEKGKGELALAMFKINTRLFPNEANTFDSLGEAYLTLGMKKEAILSYKQVLKLSPSDQNALQQLELINRQK